LEGTFPLPEAQVDRFLMRVGLGYPQREEERQILHRFRTNNPLVELASVVTTDDIRTANQICRQVFVHPVLEDYVLDLVNASRSNGALALGVSPRGTLALYRTSQALAALRGRHYVVPDDIKRLATPVLAHRLVLGVDARLHSRSTPDVLTTILEQTPVPVEEVWTEEK
jgi:MoxR-like ATPase